MMDRALRLIADPCVFSVAANQTNTLRRKLQRCVYTCGSKRLLVRYTFISFFYFKVVEVHGAYILMNTSQQQKDP